jgi:hypothetical protein
MQFREAYQEIKFEERIFGYIAKEIKKAKESSKDQVEFNQKYDQWKKEFEERYPEHKEVVDVVFGVGKYAQKVECLDKEKKIKGDKKEFFLDLCSWMHQATQLLIEKGQDKNFASSFWKTYREIFDTFYKNDQTREGIIRGIVGQAGVFRTLERLGLKPSLASPKEDAFEKTDLWVKVPEKDESFAIQTKYSLSLKEPMIESTEEINYPTVKAETKDKTIYLSSQHMQEISRLKESVTKRAKLENKKVLGLFIAVPHSNFDPETGVPSEKFLEKTREKLLSYFK